MPFILLSTLLIGAAAFLAGFVGPMIIDPGANQGPLLGIFITGPLGLLAGAVLGIGLPWIVPQRNQTRVLLVLSAATCLGIFAGIACFRGPEFVGRLYFGEFTENGPAVEQIPAAVQRWQEMANRYAHAPKTGWQEDRSRMIESAGGTAITLRDVKVWYVYRERKPWKKGDRLVIGQPMEPEREAYVAPGVVLTSPGWFISPASAVPREWPPRNPGDFLGMVEIKAAPPELRIPVD